MLHRDFCCCSVEGATPTEPFVHHDPQSILVTGRPWLALYLLRSHIGDRACHGLRTLGRCMMSNRCNPKVREQHLIALP